MKIHHYTSIDTLKLILQHRTIRFNRSDQVDDTDEIELMINGTAFAKYLLISCWSTEKQESIPQWVLYSGKCKGVRITLDSNHIFQDFINATRCNNKDEVMDKVWGKRYIQEDGSCILPFGFHSSIEEYTYLPWYIKHGKYGSSIESGLAILPPSPKNNF